MLSVERSCATRLTTKSFLRPDANASRESRIPAVPPLAENAPIITVFAPKWQPIFGHERMKRAKVF